MKKRLDLNSKFVIDPVKSGIYHVSNEYDGSNKYIVTIMDIEGNLDTRVRTTEEDAKAELNKYLGNNT
jgi:hypothetical protein